MHATLNRRAVELDKDVASLDLSGIKATLTNPQGEERWSNEQADVAELWYRRYLHLKKHFPNQTLVPRKFIDKFWHTHILDTRKYSQDCDRLFGSFLHHYPYFGMNGPADAARWTDAVVRTEELFLVEFGESLDDIKFPGVSSYCSASCSSPCGDG